MRFNEGKPKPGEPFEQFEALSPHPLSLQSPRYDGLTVVLQPGQTIRILTETRSLTGGYHVPLNIPARAGRYRIVYSYWPKASADFLVVAPVVEQIDAVELMTPLEGQEGGTGKHIIASRLFMGMFCQWTGFAIWRPDRDGWLLNPSRCLIRRVRPTPLR